MLRLISAHGLAGPPGTPVPGLAFALAAAIVLIGSFLALGRRWRTPRLGEGAGRAAPAVPPVLEPVCGLAGVAAFAWLVSRGLSGAQDPNDNDLPSFVYVSFWPGLVLLSVLVGDAFAPFNPWRAVARAAGWSERRLRAGRLGDPLPYPAWLGRWPAVVSVAAFAWLELASADPADPSTLAALALAYAAVQLLGMALFGVEPWTRHGDGLGVAFSLFGRLALLTRRPLLSGVPGLDPVPGTVALLWVVLGFAGFDGLSATRQWGGLVPDLYDTLGSLELAGSAGLLATILVVAAVYWVGIAGMQILAANRSKPDLARQFAHTLIPVVAAYVGAHYVTFLVGHGLDTRLDKTVTWVLQVAILVAGHVGGLVLAHDRALVLFGDTPAARRAQQWMLAVMAGYAGLGLWLLASLAR
jgi:hypothetical protein